MKLQKHINNTLIGSWSRCKSVTFEGETAVWELSKTGEYSFFDAYPMAPHRQLIGANDDDSLRAFVKAWGPLRGSLPEIKGRDLIETYRRERNRLVAIVQLLTAVEAREMQRDALRSLLEISRDDKTIRRLFQGLRDSFQILGNVPTGYDKNFEPWIETANRQQIETATEILVLALPVLSVPRFTVERGSRGSILRASLGIYDLAGALDWMVWQDVFQQRPFQFCEECRALFQPSTHHEKKYCSKDCAHRKTARESAQRKRQERKIDNGTQKAK